MSDDPRKWPLVIDRNRTRHLTLPSGAVQVYEEDVLADMCVTAIREVAAGLPVPEVYLMMLRHLAGEEEWATVLGAIAMEPEIVESLTGGMSLD